MDEATRAKCDVRQFLVDALHADLIGPYAGRDTVAHQTGETLSKPPSRWYLGGFLAPREGRSIDDPTEDEELGAGDDDDSDDGADDEPDPRRRKMFPASMGLTVYVPKPEKGDFVSATVTWADYVRKTVPHEGDTPRRGPPPSVWERVPRGPVSVDVALGSRHGHVSVPDSGGVTIEYLLESAHDAPGLPKGAHALSVFVVNEREPAGDDAEARQTRDEHYLFQVRLELGRAEGFLPRRDRRSDRAGAPIDDRIADLHFRERSEWAVGHGVAVETVPDDGEPVTGVATTWLPTSEVRRVTTHAEPGVVVAMEELARIGSGDDVKRALSRLPSAYAEWIDGQRDRELDSAARRDLRDSLMKQADGVRRRIEAGIDLLARDDEVRLAFTLANDAMARASRQRSPERGDPAWRLFQLAFLLMCLPSISDEEHPDRALVELIYFPTGGGKTEAYLGVIAVTLLLRRLRGHSRPDGGVGVAVILRYTLRLLTLDQLGRAATLICALEQIRQERPEQLGDERYSVGLWVGRSATASTMRQVAREVTDYRNGATKRSPFPLADCPWCGTPLKPNAFTLEPLQSKPTSVRISCLSTECAFNGRQNVDGLPILFVDEQIYREVPAFVLGTVDKFAMIPWRGETGLLFGKATHRAGRDVFGPLDRPPAAATALPDGLRPPELIVQDELHLISGPLGTMVGLYETLIAELCRRTDDDGESVPPKILASTATVRRAHEQIERLFGRKGMQVFPPPAVDENESWFARVNHDDPGRLYVGVAAGGRALKGIMRRTYTALLTAAQWAYDDDSESADPYMTVVGYFNSLRELGGMRRLVEDDMRTQSLEAATRKPASAGSKHRWSAERRIRSEPIELTSRESTGAISKAKDRLGEPHSSDEHVDVVLASNMISVGVDIDRLGLMVIGGQPKTTSEYIQASSRVGRQHPGLVVTCLNLARPRDRSHFEHFTAYHESFYRNVEATTLTPFSGPALERGLAAVLVGAMRFANHTLTPSGGVMAVSRHVDVQKRVAEIFAERAAKQAGRDDRSDVRETMRARCRNLLEALSRLVDEAREDAGERHYSEFDKEKSGRKVLWHGNDADPPPESDPTHRFSAPTSMRDVEGNVHLWVRTKLGAN